MGHTIFFLTATLIAGQNNGTEITVVSEPPRTTISSNPAPADPTLWERVRSWKPFGRNSDAGETSERPRLFQRMQSRVSGMFQRSSTPEAGSTTVPQATPGVLQTPTKTIEPPLGEPAGKGANLFVAPITFHTVAAPAGSSTPATKPLSPAIADKTGHDADYTWITGQLRKENGTWIIYYANPEVVDRYNGRLKLIAPAAQMGSARDGDLVSVQGRASGAEGSSHASYNATAVNFVEHATH